MLRVRQIGEICVTLKPKLKIRNKKCYRINCILGIKEMANKPLDTTLLDRAIVFAVRAHAGTERRGKGFHYIVHPLEPVEIEATMTNDQ